MIPEAAVEAAELADWYADFVHRYHGITTSSSKQAAGELLALGYRKIAP